MKTIGLTGSIGMGKTATAKIFAELGIPVFDSDAAVHALIGPGGAAVQTVEDAFPGVVDGNQINRQKLGAQVFSDQDALAKLESILHPEVMKMREEFTQNQNTDLILYDIPLLFEKGYESDVDYILVVTAPKEVQRERVLSRPGMSVEKFESILAKQLPDEEKRKRADFILHTDQGFDYAREQAKEILINIRAKDNA